jgi:PAS domain S-box-containing protein
MAVPLLLLGLLILGFLFTVVAIWQWRSARQWGWLDDVHQVVPANLLDNDTALILVGGRGRVLHINQQARQWFGLEASEPNLNFMANRAHPADTFREVFLAEGRAAFRLGQRQVEALSFVIPSDDDRRMVVVLRELGMAKDEAAFNAQQALQLVGDVSEILGQSSAIEERLQSILQTLQELVRFDFAQIKYWDAERNQLRPAARFGNVEQRRWESGEDPYAAWLVRYRQSLLIGDTERAAQVSKPEKYPFRSFLGLPLQMGNRFMGTLELAATAPSAFDYNDLNLAQNAVGQLSVAIENSRLYRDQSSRLAELNGLQKIAGSADFLQDSAAMYSQLCASLAQLMNVEVAAIFLHQESRQQLVVQAPAFGLRESALQNLRMSVKDGSFGQVIFTLQEWWFTNSAPGDATLANIGLNTFVEAARIRSMMLVPIAVGKRRIGMVLIANPAEDRDFTKDTARILAIFAAEVGVVMENARLFREQQRSLEEMSTLQNIAKTISHLQDGGEVYSQLSAQIAQMMKVELCGFLLVDDKRKVLSLPAPMYGIGDRSLDNYEIPLEESSVIQALWTDEDHWYSNYISNDLPRSSQVARLAKQLDIRKSLMAVVQFGGRRLGVIQVSNKTDGGNFDEQDAEVLLMIANQTAIFLDNLRLYEETQRRILESETLREIAEKLASAFEFKSVVGDVLNRTMKLLNAQGAGIGLLDTTRGRLVYHSDNTVGFGLFEPLEIDIFSEGFVNSTALSRRAFISDRVATDRRILPSYREFVSNRQVETVLMVPVLIQDRTIGELSVINKQGGLFNEADQSVLQAVAAQIAAAIERARLYQATDADLRLRVQELDSMERIGTELSQNLDLERILEVTRNEVIRTLGADYVSVAVFAPRRHWYNAETPLIERRLGGGRDWVNTLSEAEQRAVRMNQTVLVPDYQGADFRPMISNTRSSLVEPLRTESDLIGLIHVMSEKSEAFDEAHKGFVGRVARQTALAVANAQRYLDQSRLNEALQGRTNQIGRFYSLGQMIRQGADLKGMLQELSRSLAETSDYEQVIIQVVNEARGSLELVASHGLSSRALSEIPLITYTPEQAQQLLQERWLIGQSSYFLPSESADEWFEARPGAAAQTVGGAWQSADAFLAPLYRNVNNQQSFFGWVSLRQPRNQRRPDALAAETLETFAAEVAFTLENYRHMQSIREEATTARVERDRLALLHLVASELQHAGDMPTRMQVIVDGVQGAGWNRVRLSLRDENWEHTQLATAGYAEEELSRLRGSIRSGEVWRERLQDPAFINLKIGGAFYARYDSPWFMANRAGRSGIIEPVDSDKWHPMDSLYIPFWGQTENRLIAMLTLEDPRDGLRPTEDSLNPLEMFCIQAAASLESLTLYLQMMRQREAEQQISDMMSSVAASLETDRVLRTLASGLQHLIAFTRMHVALPNRNNDGFLLRRVEVMIDQNVFIFEDDPVPMAGTALGQCFQNREPLLFDLSPSGRAKYEAYSDLSKWAAQGERISLMVPMITGGVTFGVLRLGSELVDAYGFSDRIDLVGRLANLSAVSINHSRLLDDLRSSTSYNEAVVESIQQGIVVLDKDHRITSINAFMRLHYGWDTEAVVGHSLYQQEPEFEVFLRHSIQLALDEGTPQHQFELQDVDKQGNNIIRNFYSYPLREDQTVSGVVLLIEDVTERALLESNLAQRAEQLAALTAVSSQITSTLASDDVVAVVLEALENVMPFDGVTLWLREGEQLKVVAARGFNDPGTAHPSELIGLYVDIANSALFQDMASSQKILNVGDTTTEETRFPGGNLRVYKNWLGAPLVSQSEVVGAIALEKREARFYDLSHEQLLQAFANQASIALRNAQLFEQTTLRAQDLESQRRRLELLNRVAVALAQSLDIENIFEITLRETAIALDVFEALALKVDHEQEVVRGVVDYPRGENEPDVVYSLSGNLILRRLADNLVPLLVLKTDRNYAESLADLSTKPEVNSVLFVPLVVGGTMIGLMRFDCIDHDPYFFTQERLNIAQTLASQAAIAVQNASLFEQSVMRTHELETLFEASQSTSAAMELDETLSRVVQQLVSALRADYCSISLWNELESFLEVRQSMGGWGDKHAVEAVGTIYDLSAYPIREHALLQREVIKLRPDQVLDENEAQVMLKNNAKDRLLVPLVVNDYSIGLIDLEIRNQNRLFESADVRLARTLATQSAVAIENARLQTETRAQIEELYIINDLSTAVSSKVNVDELFPMVRDQLPMLTDADNLYLCLYEVKSGQLVFPVAVTGEGEPLDLPPQTVGLDEFSHVIRSKSPLLLWGAKMDELRTSYGIQSQFPESKCFLGVPLISGEEVLGVLAVRDDENSRAFDLNDQRILTTVASQLAVAIQNARLFRESTEFTAMLEDRVSQRTEELAEERQRVQTLYDITSEVAASLDISRVLAGALERVAKAIGATSAVIMGIDEVSEQLYVLHSFGGLPARDDFDRTQLRQDQGLAGWVLANRQGVVIPDVQLDSRWDVTSDRDRVQRSAVAALLEVGEDSRGVMMLFSDKPQAFNEDHLKLVSAAARQLANSMSNAELYSLIRDQAERLGAILREEQRESTKNTAILDSVTDGIMYANEQGNIVLLNSSGERILGVDSSRMIGRAITEISGLYGSSGVWQNSMQRWISDPVSIKERGGEDFVEESVELEDGRIINVRLSPVVMGDQFLGTVSVFRDITNVVEVDRLKTEFVATVSHELRTPMTSIKGYADLLLLGAAGEVTEGQQRFLETIKQNADRLSILVNDLLEVSRIDQGRVPLHFTTVDVSDLLQTIADHLQARIDEKERPLRLETQLAEGVPPLRADYDKIIQIMQNLADNAFNYTLGEGLITLGAYHEAEHKAVVLYVKDTGVGIPESVGERVFDRFFRGDEYQEVKLDTPGTGLGLSIVKSLVEIHGGSIWYESEVGKGTTFFVRLPVVEESAALSQSNN